METKKSRDADLERRRPQRFLLGLVMALALFFVALEWNSSDSGWTFFEADDDLEAELELEPLKRDADEIPMMLPQEKTPELPKSEQLRLVDDAVDTEIAEMPENTELQEIPEDPDQPEQAEVVDMYDEPVDIRVVEDLPQFPGGAVEFMKWLTKNLRYPPSAQQRKIQGKVVAQFIVEKDGTINELQVIKKLDPSCDREALRVLRLMPKWKAGLMDAKPCRTQVCIPIVFKL